jgi:hypothetical protein
MMNSSELPVKTKTRGSARRALLAAAAVLSIALPQSAAAGGVIKIAFDADNFDTPLDIDNPFLPMEENTTQIYKAEGVDGCEVNVVTVTDDTKPITIPGNATIQVRVVEDLAYEDTECDGADDNELVEKTFDWFGQDNAGNVWYFGEDTFNCDPNPSPPPAVICTLGDGSWEAGQDVADVGHIAEPGIIMLADPDNGDQYHQEFYEGFAEDQAKVTGISVKVILEREDAISLEDDANCIKTKEWSPLDPGHVEQKYYCEDIGLVAVDEHHGKELRFELVTGAAASSSDAFDFRTVPGTR